MSLKKSEKEALASDAKKYGLTMGDLVYYILRNRPVKVLVPEHTDALRRIASMSNNINQIAHDCNAAVLFRQHIPDNTLKALNNVLAELDRILTKTV